LEAERDKLVLRLSGDYFPNERPSIAASFDLALKKKNDTFNRQKQCSLRLKEHLLAKLTKLGKRGGSRTREYIANGKQFNTAQDKKLKLKEGYETIAPPFVGKR
jgi:hypothetical protein